MADKDLISRQALLEAYDREHEGAPGKARRLIEEAPAVDAAPVVSGQWVVAHVEPGYFTPGGNRPWICSECGYLASWNFGVPTHNFCPNCGAKMGYSAPEPEEDEEVCEACAIRHSGEGKK